MVSSAFGRHQFTLPKRCGRCGQPAIGLTMSEYDDKLICLHCKEEERKRPDYQSRVIRNMRAYTGRLA